jgi:hypothetical protein
MVDHNPFCRIVVDFHSEAYFVKRCVPVRRKFCFFVCQSFKPVVQRVVFLVGPVRRIVAECIL